MFSRLSLRVRAVGFVALVGFSYSFASAQDYTYSHTGATDGFSWPSSPGQGGGTGMADTFSFTTPDGVEYYNSTGAPTYFDSFYSVTSGPGSIDGDAWWGTPDGGSAYLYFYSTNEGSVDSLAFDFAWATDDEYVPDYLYMQVYDSDFNGGSIEFDLQNVFSSGNMNGYFDNIFFHASDVTPDDEFFPLQNIQEVEIYVGDISNPELTGEFVIDNVAINGDGTSGIGSDLLAPFGILTKYLRNSGTSSISVGVTNNGTGATTFTQTLEPGGDSEIQAAGDPPTMVPIGPSEEIHPASVASISRNEPSGSYSAQVRTQNDLNGSDPDDISDYTIELYDPPILTDNSSTPVPVETSPVLSIANASVEPHAGALRAGAEVTASQTSGDGFSVVGMLPGDFVEPGETEVAAVAFSRFGKLTKVHEGTFTAELKMNSQAGSFLNLATPVDPVTWNLEYDLEDTLSDSASLASDESVVEKVGVNTSNIATTIVDGTSSTSQTIAMNVVASPGPGATTNAVLVGEAVDLDFGTPGDQYVLQFTYTDEGIPGSLVESQLDIVYFNDAADEWQLAIDANSDSGAGSTMFAGSYDDFVASLSGSPVPLSAYGVDVTANHAWAVLDHDSIFGLGAVVPLTTISGDFNGDGMVDAADYTVWRNNLGGDESVLGEAGDGSGTVDVGDYQAWKSNFGTSASGALVVASQVPEPVSGVLVLLVGISLVKLRRR